MDGFFDQLKNYSSLGYDVSLTYIVGKEGIRMVKRYSNSAERHLVCEQIYQHDKLTDTYQLNKILDFLYQDIQKQEKTKNYRESIETWLKSY